MACVVIVSAAIRGCIQRFHQQEGGGELKYFGWCPKSKTNTPCWLKEVGISGFREKLATAWINETCLSGGCISVALVLGVLQFIAGVRDGGCSLQSFMSVLS